jgi:hypothetical protein
VDEFGDGVEIELEHDIGAMGFGRVDTDTEEGGDFLIGLAFGEKLENLAFARGEAGTRGARSIQGGIGGVAGGGDAGGEIGLVLTKGVDGGEEDAVGVVFEDVTAGAGVNDLLNEVFGFMHGEDEDFGIGRGFVNAASGLDAVEERHADVEDGDMWLEFGGFFDGIAAVSRLSANFPAGMGLEEGAEAGANNGVVIGDEDAKKRHVRSLKRRVEKGKW